MINETIILLIYYYNQEDGNHRLLKHIINRGYCPAYLPWNLYLYEPLRKIFSKVILYDYLKRRAEIGIKAINEEVIALVRKEHPKYILWTSFYDDVQQSTLQTIRQDGSIVVGWFFDDEWRFNDYSKWWIPYLDYCVTNAIEAVPKYRALNARVIQTIPNTGIAIDRNWSNIEEKYEVSFVGSTNVADRKQYLNKLKERTLPIRTFGEGSGGYVSFEEMIDIFKTSKINLNFSGTQHLYHGKTQIKGRVFQVCMAGGFLLTEHTPDIENYFELDKEIVCFENAEEMTDKVIYYLNHETERQAIAQAGWKRATGEYTSLHMVSKVFHEIEQDIILKDKESSPRPYPQKLEMPIWVRMILSLYNFQWGRALLEENDKQGLWKDTLALSLSYNPFNIWTWYYYVVSFLPSFMRPAFFKVFGAMAKFRRALLPKLGTIAIFEKINRGKGHGIMNMDKVVKSRSDTECETIKVLYAGYLPVFSLVGSHPQFEHLTSSPPGYEFVYVGGGRFSGLTRLIAFVVELLLFPGRIGPKLHTILRFIKERNIRSQLQRFFHPASPPSRYKFEHTGSGNLRRITRLIASAADLLSSATENGAKRGEVMRFILTRDVLSQLRIPTNVSLVFLPTWPYILGQVPWIIEIEDPITLFKPFVLNGQTSSLEIFDAPYYPVVKALLESDSCRGIICHVKSTAEGIPLLFNSVALRKKTFHLPLGIQLPPTLPSPEKREDNVIRILFTNSWHQDRIGFYIRGGLDLLEAFSILASKYPNLRLILRTALPHDLDGRYLKIIKNYPVEVADQFLTTNDMEELFSNADIYVLPSARLHAVSILKAMAHGLALVVSDGWGITEYVEDGRNGIVVRGRYGKCSWMDEKGMLREDYRPLFSPDPFVVSGLVDSLSTLIEDRNLRERLGQAARSDIETRFSIDNWNRSLAKILDQALL